MKCRLIRHVFFLVRMDQNNSLEISFDEWRSFFINNPTMLASITSDPQEMLEYWRNVPVRNFVLKLRKIISTILVHRNR